MTTTSTKRRLTAAQVRNAGPGKYYDAGARGLFLRVAETGGRCWFWRGRIKGTGRRVDIGLGSAELVSPGEARAAALAARKAARAGSDPRDVDLLPVTVTAPSAPLFRECAEATIRAYEPTWTNPRIADQWRSCLARYAGPLMARPCDAITPRDVLAVVSPVWVSMPTTGGKLLQRIRTIFDRCVVVGHRPDNPAQAVKAALPKRNGVVEHQRSLPFAELGAALAKIAASDAPWAVRLCARLQVLTATRPSEARLMKWGEVDGDTWTVPAERSKTRRALRVPLSRQALAVLAEARALGSGRGLIFPGGKDCRSKNPFADATLSALYRRLDIAAVPHGARSSFRMWAAEKSDAPREIAEFCLGHVVGSAAERAYMRSDLFAARRSLMERWGEYVSG